MELKTTALFHVVCNLKKQATQQRKLLRIMRLTAILLLSACITASAKTGAQAITLSVKNASLEKVFTEIKKQTGYSFVYNNRLVEGSKKISLTVSKATVEEVLQMALKDQPLTFEIIDRTIVIKPKEDKKATDAVILSGAEGQAPPIDVKGRILNEKGEPVIASVQVKGTNKGTTTNDNGEFELKGVDDNATLVISGVSIESFEVKVNGRSELALNASIKTTVGQEVIINKGYYNVRQRENTGSVSKISAVDISKQPVNNPLAALIGRLPGVQITQTTGVVNGGFNVLIRGQNSLRNSFPDNGNLPLYIVDGVPYTSTTLTSQYVIGANGTTNAAISPLNNINVQDIESIEVLKDADATAIYGSRGANGVVLITTKKGKAGKTNVDVNIYSGVGKISHKMDLLNLDQYLKMRHEAFQNDGRTPGINDYDLNGTWDSTRSTDWQKTLLGGTANMFSGQMNISGGNDNTQFLVGGGYYKETTVFPGNSAVNKLSGHFNLTNISPNKKFRTVASASFLSDNSKLLGYDLTYFALTLPPNAPALYDSTGNINWQNSTWNNPLARLLQDYNSNTKNLISNAILDYELLPGLKIRSNMGYTYMNVDEVKVLPVSSYRPSIQSFVTNDSYFNTSGVNTWILEPQLEYKTNLLGGNLNLLVGSTFQESKNNVKVLYGTGYATEDLMKSLSAASSISVVEESYDTYRYNALFGRINYNLKDKYILNFVGRRDGSSRFGPDKQFANFYATGISYIFSQEKVVRENFKFLSFGKLRSSYGTTGSDQIGNYGYLSSYASNNITYQGINGINPIRLANPDYSWETNKKFDIALELGFLDDRILFNINYYQNTSSDQLVGYPLPPTTGFNSIQSNLPAKVKNTGLEIELNTINIKNKNLTWVTNFNITIPKNKLVSYPGLTASSYANQYEVGKSLYIQKKWRLSGVDPQTGVYQFEDFNHDGSITYPEDLQAIKEVSQKYYGGLQNNIKFKNIELDFFLQFTKQSGFNYLLYNSNGFVLPGKLGNQPAAVLSRWQKAGEITNIQKFTQASGPASSAFTNMQFNSDNVVSDASFIRMKNISLSYLFQLGQNLKQHIKQARVYFQAQNVFTITNYLGMDPENQYITRLPPLRVLTLGAQINF